MQYFFQGRFRFFRLNPSPANGIFSLQDTPGSWKGEPRPPFRRDVKS